MVVVNVEHQISNVEELAWDEDPSMVIDFDEDEILSYSGHDSFLSFCGNENESNARWHSSLPHHTDIYDTMKQDDKRIELTSKYSSACYKYGEDFFRQHAISHQIPLVDMLGDIFSMRTMELQQHYASSKNDAQVMMEKIESNASVHITLDEQLAVAQKNLEQSIRRSQMTRPKFIQFSENMMKNEACYNILLSLKSNSL